MTPTRFNWLEYEILRIQSGVLLSAPAPHLKHSLPKKRTNDASCSTDRKDPSPIVNTSLHLHLDGVTVQASVSGKPENNTDDSTATQDTGTVQASVSCKPDNVSSMALRQVKPHREASTSSNSGTANGLPEWAKPLENIYKMKTNSGGPIRNAVLKAIERSPPVQAMEKLRHSISKEVFKSNNASRTKKLALEVLRDAQSGEFEK